MDFNEIADYVHRSAKGDTKAFEELYKATNSRVYFICFNFLKNEQDARDAVQDTYLTAYKNINQLLEPAKFSGWIERIAINRCKDMIKKNIPIPVEEVLGENLPTEDELVLPEKYIIHAEKRKIIMDIIRSQLSNLQYETVILYYFNHFTIAEIAKLMECSEGAVKNRLSVSRDKIKKGVEKYEKQSNDKLFVFAGVPFLSVLLSEECKFIKAPDLSNNIIHEAAKMSISASAGSSVEKVVKATTKTGVKVMKTKIIAGIAAAAIMGTVGITAILVYSGGKNESKTNENTSAHHHITDLIKDNTEDNEEQNEKETDDDINDNRTDGKGSKDIGYDTEHLERVDFDFGVGTSEINGNVKAIGSYISDTVLYVVTNDNKVYGHGISGTSKFCTLSKDFESIENKAVLYHAVTGNLLVKNKDNSYVYYEADKDEGTVSVKFQSDHVIAVSFGNHVLNVYTLEENTLYITLIDEKGNILDEKKPVIIKVWDLKDRSHENIPADDIKKVYVDSQQLIIHRNDGIVYNCTTEVYDAPAEEYEITVENSYDYSILHDVTEIFDNRCNDLVGQTPLYTVNGDDEKLYIRDAFVHKEPYSISLPEDYLPKDIEKIYLGYTMYIIMKDGSVYSSDVKPNGSEWPSEWQYDREISELYQSGKILSITHSRWDLFVLCDDGVVYRYVR